MSDLPHWLAQLLRVSREERAVERREVRLSWLLLDLRFMPRSEELLLLLLLILLVLHKLVPQSLALLLRSGSSPLSVLPVAELPRVGCGPVPPLPIVLRRPL